MTQSRNIALIPVLTVGLGRDPRDPCTDEPLPYYIGRTLEPRIISCHQSDYPHMPHHVLTRDLSWRHPIKPFHTRTTL